MKANDLTNKKTSITQLSEHLGKPGMRSDRVYLDDTSTEHWGGTSPLSPAYNKLFKELVPSSGPAETIEGELLRAISKIIYRHYNDGDVFSQGSFDLITQAVGSDFNSYDEMADKVVQYVLDKNGKYTPNGGIDWLDSADYGPDDDDEDDDEEYTGEWDYEDDEDDNLREEGEKAPRVKKPLTAKQKMSQLSKEGMIAADSIRGKGPNTYIFRRGYYYRHGMDAQSFAQRVSEELTGLGISHKLVDCGDKWAPFKGGASLASQSHFWAVFTVSDAPLEPAQVSESKLTDPDLIRMRNKASTKYPNYDKDTAMLKVLQKGVKDGEENEKKNKKDHEKFDKEIKNLKKDNDKDHKDFKKEIDKNKKEIDKKADKVSEAVQGNPWCVYDETTKDIKKRFKTREGAKKWAEKNGGKHASSAWWNDNIKKKVDEAVLPGGEGSRPGGYPAMITNSALAIHREASILMQKQVTKYKKYEAGSDTIPAGPDTSKFRASRSGMIEYAPKTTVHGGGYSHDAFYQNFVKIGGLVDRSIKDKMALEFKNWLVKYTGDPKVSYITADGYHVRMGETNGTNWGGYGLEFDRLSDSQIAHYKGTMNKVVSEGANAESDEATAVVAEVIKLIGEGHTEVSPDVITTKVSAAIGKPFMLKDLVAVNNSSPALQHYIDSINPTKIKFSTDILTVKNEDPVKEKEKAQSGVASMASRAANRSRLGENFAPTLRNIAATTAQEKEEAQTQFINLASTAKVAKEKALQAKEKFEQLSQKLKTLKDRLNSPTGARVQQQQQKVVDFTNKRAETYGLNESVTPAERKANRDLWDKHRNKNVVPSIDRERYTEIPGLEGPFQWKSGRVVYYDPREGKYYDRDRDMYLDNSEVLGEDGNEGVYSWRSTKREDGSYDWSIVKIAYQKPVEVVKSGNEPTRARAVAKAKKAVMVYRRGNVTENLDDAALEADFNTGHKKGVADAKAGKPNNSSECISKRERDGYAEGYNSLQEGWESGPDEREPDVDRSDWDYDQAMQDKLDAKIDAQPKKETYQLLGRGPNMESNWDFGLGEFDNIEDAKAKREELMANPETPNPRMIGIHTIRRTLKEWSGQPTMPLRSKEDYLAKRKALTDIQQDPDTAKDPMLKNEVIRRLAALQVQWEELQAKETALAEDIIKLAGLKK